MLSSRLQESATQVQFKTGLVSTQMGVLNPRNLLWKPCLPADASSHVRQVKWLKTSNDTWAGPVLRARAELAFPLQTPSLNLKMLLSLVPHATHLPLRYTVSDLLFQNVLFVIFYCINGQWASWRSEWWQL